MDYGFQGPDTVSAGWTTLTLENQGEELHHLQLLRLPEGLTLDDLLAALAEGEAAGPPPPGLESAGGVGVLAPGGASTAQVNLEEGDYALVCFIPDANGVPHVALGMAQAFTVTAAEGPAASEPEGDLTIDMFDFGFDISAPITAGTQTIQVTNSGPQEHEALALQLAPGATVQDFLASFEPGAEGPPPGLPIGGFQSIADGGRGYFTANFEPGNYSLVCFVTDVATGAPHAVLGMVKEFTVQ